MARIDSEQRQRILDAAVTVFSRKGVKGATTRLLGREAGVNSALIYYYFENKHTMFVEAIRMVLGGFLDHLAERRKPFADARERLAFLVDGLFDYYTAHPDRMRLMGLAFAMHGDLLGHALAGFVRSRVLVPLEVLAEGIKRGELRKGHPIHAWWSIMGLCFFSLNLVEVTARLRIGIIPLPKLNLKARRKEILELLMHGLATDEAGRSKS
ncbi:MAG TPA: TetR/AcrR family transcriptional regulator [Kiritimatiellia bacterium]|nr:TetR/AcrR family transcriptional regulator [Kiritimatiellia bacterium]